MQRDSRSGDLSFNAHVARIFNDYAALLRLQDGNPFRINAYVAASATLETLDRDVRDLLREEGVAGLMKLPTIGRGLASSIEEIARTGRFSQLDRLRGAAEPERLFRAVPGIGPVLSRKIHDHLHVATLEALEVAAHDGRLEQLPGIGPRRVSAIQAGLASLLGRAGAMRRSGDALPPVPVLLEVDAEYRRKAAAKKLPLLAPKRFNPSGTPWLPVLHTERDTWHFTVLFSNTARAHELQKTDDWVVAYFYDGDHTEGQCTIVTETRGDLEGRRVVRGREPECREAYAGGYGAGPTMRGKRRETGDLSRS